MKQVSINGRSARQKQWWLIVLLGLPLTSTILVAAQLNLPSTIATWIDQATSSLNSSYRYHFFSSLQDDRSPIAALQQEIAVYQRRVRQFPNSALDHGSLASAYFRMGRATGQGSWYLLAEAAAQKSVSLLPFDNSEGFSILARVAEARHDFAAALKLSEQVSSLKEALSVQVTSNLAMGKLAAAQEAVDRLVDQTLSLSSFTLQALVNTAQGKDTAALQSFQHALSVEEPGEISNSARTRVLLGRFYYERGQLSLARDLYREALQILPDYPMALLNLAQLEIRTGDYSSAEQHYQQLVDLSDGVPTVYDPLILRGKARIQLLKGDRSQAEALWTQAETILRQSFVGTNPGSFGHRRDLARLLLERDRPQDIAEAVALMQTEVKLRRDAETLDVYAWALSRANRWQEAQQVIQEAIGSGVHNAMILTRAAAIEQALGHAGQSRLYIEQAKAVDPQFDDRAEQAVGLASGLGA